MPTIARFPADAVRRMARADALLAVGRLFTDEAGVEMLEIVVSDHPDLFAAAPAVQQPDFPMIPTEVIGGPGTELSVILKSFGIAASDSCPCKARAREMDERGCDWCEQNIDIIVGWLREEAAKRGLPFIDAAGRLLVRRAIRNARRASRSSGTEAPPETQ